MRLRWAAIESLCKEAEELTGGSHSFWIEAPDGSTVAGTAVNKTKRVAKLPLEIGETEVGSACSYGRESEAWVKVFLSLATRELRSQATVNDMADATARLWKHTNALMRMAASTKLSLDPAATFSSILGILGRSTRLHNGIGVVQKPGAEDFVVYSEAGPVGKFDSITVAPLFGITDGVRLVTIADTTTGLYGTCGEILGKFTAAAVANLSTETEHLGFVIVPVDDAEKITSEDLKVLTSAAQIISVAIENGFVLGERMQATRLQVENELLAQQNQDMEELVHIVAHDLRSPMTALYGFVHVALDELKELRGKLDEEGFAAESYADGIAEPLRDAIRSVEKLNRMVQRLLEFSRSARGTYAFESIELGRLVQVVVRSLRFQITKKEIDIRVALLPNVRGDRVQLEALFSNLVDNAVKYMGEGQTKEIHIGCQTGGTEAVYYVRDTGVGMTAEQIPRAFLPFQRFHTDAAPGDGIGLPHVRKIVERHGGRIWCESEPGVGSTFFFTLGDQAPPSRMAESRTKNGNGSAGAEASQS
jgi:signal transduction histidine kinase